MIIAPRSLTNVFRQARIACCALLALSALAITAPGTNAQAVVFGSGANYDAGLGPWGLVSGDFNGDGYQDLAVANHGFSGNPGALSNGVSVLLGKANGTFQNAVSYPGGVGPTYLVSADLNRDGKLDLATADAESKGFSVLLGNGDGTFQAAATTALSDRPTSIIAADFNRDGFLDLALGLQNNLISVLLSDTHGGFQSATNLSASVGFHSLAVADFNRDGKLDLVTSSASIRTASVLLGNGDGTFQSPISSSTGGSSVPNSFAVGDFNRDGKADLAIASSSPPDIEIMLGNGDGTFQLPGFRSGSINTPSDIKVSDFNGDGKLDIVSTGIFIGPNADVFLGNGDGTFQTSVPFGLGPGTLSVAVADFNADTKPDLSLVTNGEVSVVLLNVTPGQPDNTSYFVHQHYLDFLSREPDVSGFDYWTQHIDQCATDPSCTFERRIGTSAAFMVESEFQLTGYFVHRLYKASYGRRPTYLEFTVDSKKVIGGPQLEASKTTLVNAFAQTTQFKSVYADSLSNTQFVNTLFDAALLTPYTAERQAAIASLNQGASRASVLRTVVEDPTLVQREYNPAFVQMQYFGYLRRNEELPGFQFWLDILNAQPNNFRRMVCAFITSAEYQLRFSPHITHTNAECGP